MMIQVFTKQVYLFVALLALFSCFLVFSNNLSVFSGDLSEYEKKLEEAKKEKEEAESYLEYIKGEIHRIQNSGYSLDQQIRLMDEEMSKVEEEMEKVLEEIKEKEDYISVKEEELDKKQIQINKISDKLYRNSRVGFIDILFSTAHDNNMIHSLILNRFVIASQVEYMKGVANEVIALNTEKVELEVQKESFEKDQEEMDESKSLLAEQRSLVQSELNRQVAERSMVTRRVGGLDRQISELQQFLLLMRSGGTNVNVENLNAGGGPSSLEHFLDSATPTGSFAVFSFGAYTHRNGMSQWGAWARNRDGQSYEQILKFYYPGSKIEKRTNLTKEIAVGGHGSISLEERYLLGIREIHPSWNTQVDMDILKAQAIAARSYAIAYTNNGAKPICTTESCQVFSTNFHGGAWEQAVRETEGMVLVSEGKVLSTQYAAVHGGWVNNNVGYDVKSPGGDWVANSWDNISGVSWFYRNWHAKGYGSEVCSTHPNPWLTNVEMADLVNAYLYWSHNSVSSDSRLTAIDIGPCWGKKADPYSLSELKKKVKQVGATPVNSISRVTVTNNQGWTDAIVFLTDVGPVEIRSREKIAVFKEVYNMRAPAYFAIPQSGFTHINIEMK